VCVCVCVCCFFLAKTDTITAQTLDKPIDYETSQPILYASQF